MFEKVIDLEHIRRSQQAQLINLGLYFTGFEFTARANPEQFFNR